MQQKQVESIDYNFSAAKVLLEEKRVLLENELSRNLLKKHALELRINGQFEKIKVVETAIEKIDAQAQGTQRISPKRTDKL